MACSGVAQVLKLSSPHGVDEKDLSRVLRGDVTKHGSLVEDLYRLLRSERGPNGREGPSQVKSPHEMEESDWTGLSPTLFLGVALLTKIELRRLSGSKLGSPHDVDEKVGLGGSRFLSTGQGRGLRFCDCVSRPLDFLVDMSMSEDVLRSGFLE